MTCRRHLVIAFEACSGVSIMKTPQLFLPTSREKNMEDSVDDLL